MAVTTNKPSYVSTETAITCTLASLASSATVGRQCTVIDNTTNLYDDVLITISVKTAAGALANDKAVYVYAFGSEGGANSLYNADDAQPGATDAAYTINSPSNLKLVATISAPTSAKTPAQVFTLAQFFGGNMPKKWGLVIVNFTGQALDATEANHTKTYTGIQYTNS